MHPLRKMKSNSLLSNKNNSSMELLDKKIQKLQEKSVCDQLGIDYLEIPKYKYFFDQVKSIKLPDHWKAKINHSKELVYINEITKETSSVHPNMNLFKIFFYQQESNKKNAQTFHDKSRKLLPLIEQKLMKQFIGMASRRKEVQKINLLKNEQGKFVTNKISRIAPDTNKLMATRSYLLKGVVQKILTKKQIWGVGKRARNFSSLLEKKQDIHQQQVQENIQLVEKIFTEAAQFYQLQFGNLQCMPIQLQQTVYFRLLTPRIVLNCIHFLNIQKQSIEQYWIAQIMNCLPMPPLWRRLKGISFDQFYHQAYDLIFQVHPSIIYLAQQLNLFKQRYQRFQNIEKNYYLGFRQMQFIDFFQRKYEVDMFALMEKQQREIVSRQNDKINKINKKKSRQENSKFLYTQKPIEVSNDWIMLEGVMATEINYQDLSLIQYIQQFWKSIDFTDQIWEPSISPYGQVLWNHNINGSCITECPFQSRLKIFLKQFYRQIKPIHDNDLKKIYDGVNQLQQFEIGYIQKNFKEKLNYLKHYLIHHNKPVPYKINTQQFNENSYFNVVFNCPFDFQSEVLKNLQQKNQVVPLWLQKVQAKRYNQNFHALLAQTQNTESLKVIENVVKQLYIKSTQIKQIVNLEQVKTNLKQQMNKDQLCRLIDVAFDIDARELRLQKMRMKYQFVQKQQIDDLLGSSQSQIDLNDHSTVQQNPIEQVSEKQQSQVSYQSSIQKQKSVIQEQKQVQIIDQNKQMIQSNQIKPEIIQIKKSAEQIKYQLLQNISEQGLNSQIKNLKNIKMKATKYKKQKFNKKVIQKVNKIENNEIRIHYKKNLILTNLKKQVIPNKINLLQTKHLPKKSIIQSQNHFTNHSQVPQFLSHQSHYTNSSIVNIVNKLPKKEIQPIIQNIQIIKQPKHLDDTNKQQDKSFYSFVNIIKQSIKDDPILKHVDQYQEIADFNKTFRKSISTADESLRESRFITIRKILDNKNKELQSTRSHQKFTKTGTYFRKIEQEKQQNIQQKMTLTADNFKRRCISSTASQMLNTNAFSSRLDFQKMEIRKSLFLKNRGIKNFVA